MTFKPILSGMSKPLRVLGAVRLSRLTDESTSPARQREAIEGWATVHAATVAAVVEDLDVSGAVSPWDRPGLGPYLSDPALVASWDVLVVWKLDRLSRSALDTLHLLEWARENGKRVVSVADSLDSSSTMGQVWIQLSAIFAEVERTNIRERVLAARRYLRSVGRWTGGHAPYGYRPVQVDGGYRLEHDPDTYPIVREMAQRVVEGESITSIARDFTARGVPTPRSADDRSRWSSDPRAWSPSSIRAILRSPAVRGWTRHRGQIVLGPDGLPQQMGPEILSAGEWELVLDALDKRSRRMPPDRAPRGSAPLYGVIYCSCGEHMVSRRSRGSAVYQCSRRSRAYEMEPTPECAVVLADVAEQYAEENFLEVFGPRHIVEYVPVPGEDYTAEIREVRAALDRLDGAYQAGAFDGDAQAYARMRTNLRERLADLESRPTTGPTVEERDLGVTYGMLWELSDTTSRRELMVRNHFRVVVGPRVRRGRTSRDEVRRRLSWEIAEEANLIPEDYG